MRSDRLYYTFVSSTNFLDDIMGIEQKQELYIRLLEITAESRFNLMKEIWNRKTYNQDIISRTVTQLRNDIFRIIISKRFGSYHPIIRKIAENDGIPQIRKNIGILSTYGLDDKCIANLNCVNVGYVRICIRALKSDFPEIFG